MSLRRSHTGPANVISKLNTNVPRAQRSIFISLKRSPDCLKVDKNQRPCEHFRQDILPSSTNVTLFKWIKRIFIFLKEKLLWDGVEVHTIIFITQGPSGGDEGEMRHPVEKWLETCERSSWVRSCPKTNTAICSLTMRSSENTCLSNQLSELKCTENQFYL